MTPQDVQTYFSTLAAMPGSTEVTDRSGTHLTLTDFYRRVIDWCPRAQRHLRHHLPCQRLQL
jgi:hypothetical protein